MNELLEKNTFLGMIFQSDQSQEGENTESVKKFELYCLVC